MSIEIGDGGLGYIYLGDILIAGGGGESGWKPGANTLAYYPLEGNVADTSGNGKNGTISGSVSFTTSEGNQVASFSGGYVTIPALGVLTGSATVSLWIKSSQASAKECVALYIAPSGDNASLSISVDSGIAKSFRWDGSHYGNCNSNTTVNNNVRHHIATTQNGSTQTIYVDGVSKGTLTYGYNLESGIYTGLGANIKNPGNFNKYNGLMSRVIFENKVWTSDEISAYYNQTKSNYGL